MGRYQSRIFDRLSAAALGFLLIDGLLLFVAFPLAVIMRLESLELFVDRRYLFIGAFATLLGLIVLVGSGIYKTKHKNYGSEVVTGVATAVSLSTAALPLADFFLSLNTPRSIPLIYGLVSIVFLAGWRLGARLAIQRVIGSGSGKQVVVCGVDESARQFVKYLVTCNGEAKVVALVDLDESKSLTAISGVPVVSRNKFEGLLTENSIELVLCVGREIVIRELLMEFPSLVNIEVRQVPSVDQMLLVRDSTGHSGEPISLDQLLRRDQVDDSGASHDYLTNKVILVTGGGGSIGSELVRQMLKHQPERVVVFENSELALYQMAESLGDNPAIKFVLGSVTSANDLRHIFRNDRVDVVFHAAAYKHVPLVEENPLAAVVNNVFGTKTCVDLAHEFDIDRFVLISTDKAVRPTNVMGCTKRLCELIVSEASARSQTTKFGAVRFGNVLGSSGSVIPKFRQQIAGGGPVTVTHPDVERFFMTIPEAVKLVLDASTLMTMGKTEVFVLDMGGMVRIADLARSCIELSGYQPVESAPSSGQEIQIVYTGLRPGEKMYEELHVGPSLSSTNIPKILSEPIDVRVLEGLDRLIEDLRGAVEARDIARCVDTLRDGDLGFER